MLNTIGFWVCKLAQFPQLRFGAFLGRGSAMGCAGHHHRVIGRRRRHRVGRRDELRGTLGDRRRRGHVGWQTTGTHAEASNPSNFCWRRRPRTWRRPCCSSDRSWISSSPMRGSPTSSGTSRRSCASATCFFAVLVNISQYLYIGRFSAVSFRSSTREGVPVFFFGWVLARLLSPA